MGLILDTNLIIWAERESKAGETGQLERFFAPRKGEYFFKTFTVLAQRTASTADGRRPAVLPARRSRYQGSDIAPSLKSSNC